MKKLTKFLLSNLVVLTLVGCANHDAPTRAIPESSGSWSGSAPSALPAPAVSYPRPAPAPMPSYPKYIGGGGGGGITGVTMPKKKNGETKYVTVPYRRFLLHGKGQNVLQDVELKSFVIFTHRPADEAELKMYQAVCRQWVADFDTYEAALETASYLPLAKLTPFYWPTQDKEVTSGDCNTLYNYDYAFAAAVMSLTGISKQSVGPVLVLQQNNEWLTLDISKFEPVDVQRSFFVWKTQIVSANPLSAKFTLVKFREYFRTLVNLYGESIAKYVKIG